MLSVRIKIFCTTLHRLHIVMPKKIGSGFDVATAIYGLIVYRRFQPALINDVFQVLESDPEKFPTELKN